MRKKKQAKRCQRVGCRKTVPRLLRRKGIIECGYHDESGIQ